MYVAIVNVATAKFAELILEMLLMAMLRMAILVSKFATHNIDNDNDVHVNISNAIANCNC